MHSTALDMIDLCDSLNATLDVIIAHSLGGKVASTMTTILHKQNRAPKQVWILDSIVDVIKAAHANPAFQEGTIAQVIDHVKQLPLPIPSHRWLQNNFLDAGFTKEMATWMTTNLRKVGNEQYTWKFNLSGCEEMFADYLSLSLWEFLENPPPGTRVEFVIAERSPRWNSEIFERFSRVSETQPRTRFHRLDSGHSVHFENPKGLYQLFTQAGLHSIR